VLVSKLSIYVPQYEAVPESLKNVVLVMHSSDMLVPPSEPDTRTDTQKALWKTAHDRIERFLPGFMVQILPPPPALDTPASAPTEQVAA
jgi:brefeldin A-resistance guanine nucleotide exchange factor 1